MRYSKASMLILCLGGYIFINQPAYSFYQDDRDHSETIKKVQEQRQKSKERLEENQKKKPAEQREKNKTQAPIAASKQNQLKQAKPESQKAAVFFWLVFAFTGGLLGYIFYLYKKK